MRDNALRMQDSCEGTLMAQLPVEKFEEAVIKAVKLNERFVPPYESGASLYIRPFLFGTGAQVGVNPPMNICLLYLLRRLGLISKVVFRLRLLLLCANLTARHHLVWENTK